MKFALNVVSMSLFFADICVSELECKMSETSLNGYWRYDNIFKPEGCIDRSLISLRQIDHGGTSHEFFYLPRNGAERGCTYFGGMDCDITSPQQFDTISQSKLIEDSIWMDNLYGLSVSLASMDFATAIDEVTGANINVFTWNAGIDEYTQTTSQLHIGPDEFLGGTQGCNRLINNGATKILILDHEWGQNIGLLVRAAGCINAIGLNNTKTIYVKHFDLEWSAQLIAETMVNDIEINGIMALGPNGETSAHYALLAAVNDEINGFHGLTKDRVLNDFKGMGTFDYSQDIFDHILQHNFTKFGIDQQPYMQGLLPMCWLGIKAATGNSILYPAKILSGPAFVETAETIELLECTHHDVYYCHDEVDSDEYIDKHWGEIPDECPCIDTDSKIIYLFHHGGDSYIGSGLSDFYAILSSAAQQAADDINVTLRIITDQGSNNQLDLNGYAQKIENILNNNISSMDGIITTIPNQQIADLFENIEANYDIPIIGVADGYDIYKNLAIGSLPFIGENDEESGYNLSDLLFNKYIGVRSNNNATKEGLICLDATSDSLASHNERCKGVERYCTENDLEYKLIYTDSSNADGSKQAIENTVDDFDLNSIILRSIIATDDSSCLAATYFIQNQVETDDTDKITLGCYDSSNTALQGIINGNIDYIYDQQPWMIGYTAMLILTNKIFINSFPIQQIIETGPRVITFADYDYIEIKICENQYFGYNFCPTNAAFIEKMDINFPTITNFTGILILLLFILSFIFGIIVLFSMYYYRKESIFKTSQPYFVIVTVIGGIIMMMSGLFSFDCIPNNYSCNIPWIIWSLGFTIFFVSYSLRVWRYVVLIENGLSLKVRNVSYKDICIRLIIFVLIDLIISICASTLTPLTILSYTSVDNNNNEQFIELKSFYCTFSNESHLSMGWIISIIYKFSILLWVISISLRKQISTDKLKQLKYAKYYEGSNIAIGIYMIAVSFAIFFLIIFSLSIGNTNNATPSLMWIMVSFLSFLCYITVICCVMLHRIFHVFKKQRLKTTIKHMTGSISSASEQNPKMNPALSTSQSSTTTTSDFDPERIALNPFIQRAEYLMKELIECIKHNEMDGKDAKIIYDTLSKQYLTVLYKKNESDPTLTDPASLSDQKSASQKYEENNTNHHNDIDVVEMAEK